MNYTLKNMLDLICILQVMYPRESNQSENVLLCDPHERQQAKGVKNHSFWVILWWFYFREFRESDLVKISTSIYVYL